MRLMAMVRRSLCDCGENVLADHIEPGTIYKVRLGTEKPGQLGCGRCGKLSPVTLIAVDPREQGVSPPPVMWLPKEIFCTVGVPPAIVEDPKTEDDIEAWYIQTAAKEMLGSNLVDSEEHEHGCFMTEDRRWYFVPRYDDPLMTRPRLGNTEPKPIPGMFRWALEEGVHIAATRDDPEDFDIREVGRFDSLALAIEGAALAEKEAEVSAMMLSIYEQKECKLEPIYAKQLEQMEE